MKNNAKSPLGRALWQVVNLKAMNPKYKNFINYIEQDPAHRCPVCGTCRYITDQGNHELTLHCSSPSARFWDYPRGSADQAAAKKHWDQSRTEIFFSVEDVLQFLADEEGAPGGALPDSPQSPEAA